MASQPADVGDYGEVILTHALIFGEIANSCCNAERALVWPHPHVGTGTRVKTDRAFPSSAYSSHFYLCNGNEGLRIKQNVSLASE